MKSVDEHLAACLRGIDVLSPIDLQLLDAQGCVLAEDVVARTDLPVFDNSAMDGYAVHSVDVASASPANPGDPARPRRRPRRLDVGPRPGSGHGRTDHDRRAAAVRRGRRGPGRAHRRRCRQRQDPRPGPARPARPPRRRRRGLGRRRAAQGHPPRAAPDRAARSHRPRPRARPSEAAGRGPVDRQRARRAGVAGRRRPDLGLELLPHHDGCARGRGRGVPDRDRARRAQAAPRRDRGPAHPRRPGGHHRWRQRRRLRRGQGGHVAARDGGVRPDLHAARHAAGPRRHRTRTRPRSSRCRATP